MPVTPFTEEMLSSLGTEKITKYPDPFFDLGNNVLPKNIKSLFKFCRTYFYTNSFLHNVVTKLTEYPITDIIFDSSADSQVKEKYTHLLNHKLKIKNFLIEVGLDYFVYGNAFIIIVLKTKRFLKCPKCGHSQPLNTMKYKFKQYKFVADCKECNATDQKMIVEDEQVKSAESFKLNRLAPENIDIEFNPITGNVVYYYSIPNKIKKQILAGDRVILEDIPMAFINAMEKNKSIVLDQSNIFHLKFPTLAEEDMGWGKPMILPALKDIYYLQTLKRGNEAIINEHLVPKKVLSPANTATMDPYTQLNLGKWKSEIESTLTRWRRDPNYIAVMPIPVQYQSLGGDAKMLMLTPEMRFNEETIINGLGVPIEFIKGGTTWTGSSISLRIVENHFLNYRELLTDFLNLFLIPKIVGYLSYPEISVSFKKFKMADDAETKQQTINLNAAGKVSDQTMITELGFDYEKETEALDKTRTKAIEQQILEQEKQAEGQGRGQVILAKYQARANEFAQNETYRIKMELFQDEIARENSGMEYDDVYRVIDKYALQLLSMPPDIQQQQMAEMAQTMPNTFAMVNYKLRAYQTEQAQQQLVQLQAQSQLMQMQGPPPEEVGKVKKDAPNEKPVGTREEDKTTIRKSEKTKGQTRGTP